MKKIILLGLILGIITLLFSVKPLISPNVSRLSLEKSYVNKKYGFQFSYPFNWQVEEWDIEKAANLKNVADGTILYQGKFFGSSGSPAGEFEVLIWENKQSFSSNKSKVPVRTWLTWFRHEDLNLSDLPKQENFTLAGIPAIRYLQKNTSRKKPILYIFFSREDKIYELTCQREDLAGFEATESGQFLHPVYDKILQSFQFVLK